MPWPAHYCNSTPPATQYSEGRPGARYYGGNKYIDQVMRAVCALRRLRYHCPCFVPTYALSREHAKLIRAIPAQLHPPSLIFVLILVNFVRFVFFYRLSGCARSDVWKRLDCRPISGASTCSPCLGRLPTLRCTRVCSDPMTASWA